MNVLNYSRKAARILDDIAEWQLSGVDGTLANLTYRDLKQSVKTMKKAKLLVEQAYSDLCIRTQFFVECPNKNCRYYAKHKGAHGR